MRKRWILVAVAALAMLALFVAPTVAKKKRPKSFVAELTGFEEVPSVSTPAKGFFTAKVVKTDAGPAINYKLEVSSIQNMVAAHIHLGQMGVNGGVSAFLCGGGDKPACPATGGTVSGQIDYPDVVGPAAQGIAPGEIGELIKAMKFGVTYVNVHTNNGDATPNTGPGDLATGEIRGQIFQIFGRRFVVSESQAVPPGE